MVIMLNLETTILMGFKVREFDMYLISEYN